MKEVWQDDDGNLKTLSVSGLSSMWPTKPYNLSHLCSGIYKVVLPFFQNTTEKFLWNTENIFACQRTVCQ
jgi:hypothetical protein